MEKNPIAKMTMENGGVIEIELSPSEAPITVENFVNLVNQGFYNGLTIHRIVPGFVIQGGDPMGNGMGGSDKKIKGEFSENGVANNLKHTKGVISMARAFDPDSASSQFFIVLETSPMVSYSLDGKYAGFGKVISGMDVVDEIAKAETDANDMPIDEVKIKTIEIV
ncbi:MAG: peptidylprolyl isomerase [Oscillospiraceae bacterium]|nr:peptidylprolyl isomerase [Oscillospiraceae bacterium]